MGNVTADDVAKAVFYAGLPTGDKGKLIPGHTKWEDLGPKAQDRYRRMAHAAGQKAVWGGRAFLLGTSELSAERTT